MSKDTLAAGVTPSGYSLSEDYFATRYCQGGRNVYVIDLSLAQLVASLPRPNADLAPEEALRQGNRKIDMGHAQGFADYVRNREGWVSPAILLRAPADLFSFTALRTDAGVSWGTLSIPKLALGDIKIVDGQHRILGLHMALEQVARDLEEARDGVARAKKNGDPAGVFEQYEAEIAKYGAQRERFGTDRMTIQIVIEDDRTEYLQIFADIADNAKGIGAALRTTFDSSKVVNRCVEPMRNHPLLRGRVDMQNDTVRGGSPYLLSAKHVAEMVRAVEKGTSGRMTRRDEDELSEQILIRQTEQFLDDLMRAYPVLREVAADHLTPQELRDKSLLGSVTILRVLAGSYHDLLRGDRTRPVVPREAIVQGLARMPMESPIDHSPKGFWMASEVFQEPWRAPLARGGNIKRLNTFIVKSVASAPQLDLQTK